jgi:hypothetical protein
VRGGTVTEGLQVDGVTKLGQTIHRTFDRTIPTGQNTVDICTVGDAGGQGGTFMVEFTVVQAVNDYSFADKYIVPVRRLSTGGDWVWLNPLYQTGEFGGHRLRIQMKCEGSGVLLTRFRLARGAAFTGDYIGITVSMTLSQDFGSQLTITPTFTTTTDDPPMTLYGGTRLTTNGATGSVGIHVFEPNPEYSLDVNGAVQAGNLTVTDTAVVGNLQVLGSFTFGSGTESLKTGNDAVFTQVEDTSFNFSDKMRIHYNDAADAIEIQRKIGGEWIKTATLAV